MRGRRGIIVITGVQPQPGKTGEGCCELGRLFRLLSQGIQGLSKMRLPERRTDVQLLTCIQTYLTCKACIHTYMYIPYVRGSLVYSLPRLIASEVVVFTVSYAGTSNLGREVGHDESLPLSSQCSQPQAINMHTCLHNVRRSPVFMV